MSNQFWTISWHGDSVMQVSFLGYVTLDACIKLNTSMEQFLDEQTGKIDVIVDISQARILPPLAQLQQHLTFVGHPQCERFAILCSDSPYLQKLASYLFAKTAHRNVYSIEQALEFFSSTGV